MSFKSKHWSFWVRGHKVVSEEEAEVKITAIFRREVSEEEAMKHLKLRKVK